MAWLSHLLGLMIPLTSRRIDKVFFLLESKCRCCNMLFKTKENKLKFSGKETRISRLVRKCLKKIQDSNPCILVVTSSLLIKKLKNEGKALLPIYASASTLRCSNLTSSVGISMPTLSNIQETGKHGI